LIRVDHRDRVYLLTLGISLRRQPAVEMYYEDPAPHRRFEFAACVSPTVADELITKSVHYIADQSDFPWQQFTFLAHGHTIGCNTFASDPGLREHSALLLVKNPSGAPKFNLPTMDGDEVSLLWMVPITAAERELAQKVGSKELLPRMRPPEMLHVISP
jgi:Suppressor of fused protein (SUFU)